jgi:hypothetical protein
MKNASALSRIVELSAAILQQRHFSGNSRQLDGMTTEMNLQSLAFAGFFGAARQILTDDPLITNCICWQFLATHVNASFNWVSLLSTAD